MSTQSKSAFDRNRLRAQYFLAIHQDAQQGAGAPPLRYRELPRAAIVFSVGAIDAYLSELSAEILVRQLQANVPSDQARRILKRVQNDLPTIALELAVLSTNAQRAVRLRESISSHFHDNVSNHGSKAVGATMDRIGGKASDVWSHLTAQGWANPAAYLDKWTESRHRIVHQGQRETVHRAWAADFISFAEALVNRVDGIAAAL